MAINYKIHPSALNVTTGSLQVKNGSNLYEEDVTITESGDYSYEAPAGYYGLSKVNVTVDVEEVNNEDKSVTYVSNDTYTITADEEYTGLGTVTVTVDIPSDVHNQDKTVSPTTSQQTITADADYSGLGEVTVNAVTSAIDNNISSGNIKKDVTILGVTGSYDPQPTLTTLNVTPTTSAQTLTPSQEDGWNEVDVAAVDSSIDPNILSNNIKQGVTILGITGSYTAQPNLQQKSVTPTTSAQTVQADGGYDGLSEVSVSAVTSAIDSNIQSANIVSGVTILGVTGTATAGASCPDWSSIGWDCTDVNASTLADDVAYTAQQKAAYEGGTITSFMNDKQLVFAPSVTIGPSAAYQGQFMSCTELKYVPSNLVLNADSPFVFYNCSKVEKLELDASNTTDLNNAFAAMFALKTLILHNATNVTNLNSAFYGSGQMKLTSINAEFSSTLNIYRAFHHCGSLTNVPIKANTVITNMGSSFAYCYLLTELPILDTSLVSDVYATFLQCSHLTTLGGFINLGKAFTGTTVGTNTLDLSASTVLTKQSIMNVINNLAAPDDTTVTNATLKLSATSYALLDASDIAIATAKNWSVTSA